MSDYGINKGVGRSAEFQGLQSRYLLLFACGLLSVFMVVVVLYMSGVPALFCLPFGLSASSVLVWITFRLNAKYGEWGLTKLHARRRHPYYIINRRRVGRFFRHSANLSRT